MDTATCSSPLASAACAPPSFVLGLLLFCISTLGLLAWMVQYQAGLREQLAQKDAELKRMDDKLKQKEADLKQMEGELKKKDAELKKKDGMLKQRDADLRQKEAELRQKEADLEQKDARINDLIREIEEERALAVRTTARLNEMMSNAVYELIGHFVLDRKHNRAGNARRLVMVQGLEQNDWNGFQGRYQDALLLSREAMPNAQRFADSTSAERADYWELYKARWFNEVNEYSELYQRAVPHIGEEEMENENEAP